MNVAPQPAPNAPDPLPYAPVIASSQSLGWRAWVNPAYLPLLATLAVLVALLAIGGSQYNGFLSSKAFADLFNQNAFIGVAAIGATIVILSGGIDLSIGAVVAFSTIFMAKMIHPPLSAGVDGVGGLGLHPLVAALITLGVGALFGCFMGLLIALYELPPFMVTLAGMFFARAMGFVVHDVSLGINHPFYSDTLAGLAWQITSAPGARRPIPVYVEPTTIVMLAMFAVAVVLLQFTALGRNVYAVGGDEGSSRLLGVPIARTKVIVYTLSGFFSALAGIVTTVMKLSGNPADFVGLELDAIAAVVIGGTLLTGGRGFVIGTLLGVLMLGLTQQFINFNGNLRSEWARIFVGTLMLIFILLQTSFNSLGRWLSGSRGSASAAH